MTHGYLYSVMMNEALVANAFLHDPPEDGFTRLTNTAITRILLHPPDPASPLRLPGLEVLLNNCDAHVGDLGSLVSSQQPLS